MQIDSNPISIKERSSIIFLKYGKIDVQDGAFVLIDEKGVRMQIPIAGLACIFLEPGTRITHMAVNLAAKVGCLLIWVGEAGVRVYSAGQPGGARADKLLFQAKLALEPELRLKIVRAMYKFRFKEEPPEKRSIEQLRGIEGARVKHLYELFVNENVIKWSGRNYKVDNFDASDDINKCLSAATSCLYGICEAAILAAGYAPAIGFIHYGKPLSFVYDIADLFKFETVIPLAFKICAAGGFDLERKTRIACRDSFRRNNILEKIIPTINEILAAGGIDLPDNEGVVPVAIPESENSGDDGHRS